HRDGPAARRRRPLHLDLALAERAPGAPRAPLHAHGDRHRPVRPRRPAGDRADAGGRPADPGALSPPDAGPPRLALLAALMAAFGAVISEVGASLMVGGNIRGETRVLTTATVLETGKGNFEVAIALSLILLGLTFLVNWVLTSLQQGRRG